MESKVKGDGGHPGRMNTFRVPMVSSHVVSIASVAPTVEVYVA